MKKPPHLSKAAHGIYDKLYGIVSDKMKEGDEDLLAVLANTYVDYKLAREVYEDRGPVLAGETMVRQNPAFNTMKDCTKIIESLSAHFGLSPKSRGANMDKDPEVEDDFDRV